MFTEEGAGSSGLGGNQPGKAGGIAVPAGPYTERGPIGNPTGPLVSATGPAPQHSRLPAVNSPATASKEQGACRWSEWPGIAGIRPQSEDPRTGGATVARSRNYTSVSILTAHLTTGWGCALLDTAARLPYNGAFRPGGPPHECHQRPARDRGSQPQPSRCSACSSAPRNPRGPPRTRTSPQRCEQWTTAPEFTQPARRSPAARCRACRHRRTCSGTTSGAPGKLTHTADLYRYYRALETATPARQGAPRIGKTDEGRDILVVFVAARGDHPRPRHVSRAISRRWPTLAA